MAKTDPLAPKTRKAIAGQADVLLRALNQWEVRDGGTRSATANTTAPSPSKNPKLAEGFPYCFVSLATVENPPADLASLLEPTGSWIHTIRDGKQTTHYVMTEAGGFGREEHEVSSVVRGSLGQKIDDTIDWIEENFKDESVVRVLTFPAYYVHAFGILEDGKTFAVLIDPPELPNKLVTRKKYPLKDFLAALAKSSHS